VYSPLFTDPSELVKEAIEHFLFLDRRDRAVAWDEDRIRSQPGVFCGIHPMRLRCNEDIDDASVVEG
jgi:hypothetical protein